MRSTTALLACLITPALAPGLAASESAREAQLPVREVTVFKDGHALVLREGRAPTNADGDVQLFELPNPVLGAFWPYSAHDGAALRAVTAGTTTVDGERPVRGLWELLEQNVGATMAFRDTSNERKQGVLELLIAEGSGGGAGAGPMVAVRIDSGLHLTPLSHMRDVTFLTGEVDQTTTENTSRNMLTMDLDWGDGRASAEADVGLMYLQRGLRWIPSYRITIDGEGGAHVELQATLVNELIDLDNVTMNLVIGAPSFAFAGTPDPIGLQDQIAQLGRHFDRRAQTGQAMADALLSQARFGERRDYQAEGGAGAPASPEVIGGGRTEDLFVFTLTGVSLKEGERMVIPVAQYEATYEDVYRLDLPVAPPPFAWQHFNTQQQREVANLLHKPRARHIIRITNSDQYPITTAPALVMSQAAGERPRVLAQGLIPYTPARATADLAINEAFDIEFEQTEREIERRMNDTKFNGSSFHYAQLAGSMMLTNHRDAPVRLEVTRYVLGALDDVPEGVEATATSVFTDDAFAAPDHQQGHWWTWYHWPWWWMRMNGAAKLEWHTTLAPGASEAVEWTWHYWWQ